MTEPSQDMNAKIADIREWLVRIDTKVDYFNDVKHTAERAETKADEAENVASEALSLAKTNDKAIAEIKANDKWKWSAILTLIGFAVSIGIAYFS